jgi:hypothetical protein
MRTGCLLEEEWKSNINLRQMSSFTEYAVLYTAPFKTIIDSENINVHIKLQGFFSSESGSCIRRVLAHGLIGVR